MFLCDLPYDILIRILDCLTSRDIISFSLIKKCNIIDNEYWGKKVHIKFEYPYEIFLKLTNVKGIYKYKEAFINHILESSDIHNQEYESMTIETMTILYYSKFNNLNIDHYFMELITKGDYIIIEELLKNPGLNIEDLNKGLYISVFEETGYGYHSNTNIFTIPLRENFIKTFGVLMNSNKFRFRRPKHLKRKGDSSNDIALLSIMLEEDKITLDIFIQIIENMKYFDDYKRTFGDRYFIDELCGYKIRNEEIKDFIRREFFLILMSNVDLDNYIYIYI